MAFGYFILFALYTVMVFTSNWEKYALIARQRAEVDKK